jgi:hypothetical protein
MDETKPRFFKDTIRVDVLPDGENFVLVEACLFYSAELRQTVVAPEGFITDFASTPPGVRNVFPKSGPWNRPSIIHDAGYKLRLLTLDGQRRLLNKLEVDRLFLEGMVAVGVPEWKRTLMYRAVRLFGHGAFKKRRPEHLRQV